MTVDKKLAEKAAAALLKHVSNKKDSSNELLSEEQFIWLQVGLSKVPDPKKKAAKIAIPHPVYTDDIEICLITKDPQREFKDLVAKKNVKNVTRVIGVTKLRQKFPTHEHKRDLCGQYDIFMADERVLPMLPRLLGKTFFDKKKQPIPVDLKKADLAKEIADAKNATYVYIGLGACMAVKIGHTGHSAKEIAENVAAAANGIAEKLPGKWKLIQSLHVKTADSAALPIYNVLPEADAEAPATDAAPATETKKDKAAKSKPQPKPAAPATEAKASPTGSAAKRAKAAAKPAAAKRVKMAA